MKMLRSLFTFKTHDEERDLANAYFPIQSPSEIIMGHPIVGVS